MMEKTKHTKIFHALIWLAVLGVISLYFSARAKAPTTELAPAKNEVVTPTETITTPTAQNNEVNFAFAGDMMFDRYVYHSFKTRGLDHIFDNLDKTVFESEDIAFANLEGPVSQDKIVDDYPDRSLVFDMPPETIPTIKNLGLNGVSLANNHTLNVGMSGFVTTQDLLATAGIKFAGSQNGFNESNVARFGTKIPVSIICVDYLAFNNNDQISAMIKLEKAKGNFVIMFPHWGAEYELNHTQSQENAAKIWIDSGADLVIGSHPHVIEDVDVYKNKLIFYSLGNFVFDQTFSTDTQQGLILAGKLTDMGLEIKLIPIQSKNMQPQVASDSVKNTILTRILKSKNLATFLSGSDTISIP